MTLVPLVCGGSSRVDLTDDTDSNAVCSGSLLSDVDIEDTSEARSRAGKELLLAIEGQVRERGARGDGEGLQDSSCWSICRVRYRVANGTISVDIELLATWHNNVESKGVLTDVEGCYACSWNADSGRCVRLWWVGSQSQLAVSDKDWLKVNIYLSRVGGDETEWSSRNSSTSSSGRCSSWRGR